MFVDRQAYRKAFGLYLRKGTSIEWSIKQERTTTNYVWRTRGDGEVRPSHVANDGQVFAWASPPPTGHPGEDYGCRCTAEPFYPEISEYLTINLHGISDSGVKWGNGDFIRHYYNGGGRAVTVRDTGHLENIADHYMNLARLSLEKNISIKARESSGSEFNDYFENTYNMTSTTFSIGDTTIGGNFIGQATSAAGMLMISGTIEFYLRDKFIDPLDIGVEVIDLDETLYENLVKPFDDYLRGRVGLDLTPPPRPGIHTGEPYDITDDWSGTFEGQILVDPQKSTYR